MNIEEEEWVKHALLDYERKRSISKILTFRCKDAVLRGNNYMSDMLRIELEAVLHSGDVVRRWLVYKAMPQTEGRRKLIKSGNLDRVEARMFTEILPKMEKIRQEKECGIEPLFPKCYGIRNGLKGFLFEDLTAIGYKMADRRKLLDFNHATLVMSGLAQFHALSLVLVERGDLNVNDFKSTVFDDMEEMESWFFPMIPSLAKHIEENWGGPWSCYGEKLKEFSKTVLSKVLEEIKYDENNFNVLLHCDCWLTNMMFRYNSEGLPRNIRLLDFQLCNFNNVGTDLQYFLNASLNAEALKRKPELFQLYYDNLVEFLTLYDYSGELPSFEDLAESNNRMNIFGFAAGLASIPFFVQPEDSVPDDLEKWSQDTVSENEIDFSKLESETLRSTIEVLLEQAKSTGII